MKLDTTKPLKTRTGEPVVLISTNAREYKYPLLGYVGDSPELVSWTAEGRFHENLEGGSDLTYDLPEVEAWFNCYPDGRMIRYNTKEDADASAKPSRVACIKVQYEPGQYD